MSTHPKPQALSLKPYFLIATWFGSGLSPKAPGTTGSIAAIPFALLIQYYAGNGGLLLAAIALFFIGWYASCAYLKATGRNDDPSEIVVDEVVGMWLTLAVLPVSAWIAVPLGFASFRLFDIWKPWPVSWADRQVKGGLGVMLDDVLAALLAIGLNTLILWGYSYVQ